MSQKVLFPGSRDEEPLVSFTPHPQCYVCGQCGHSPGSTPASRPTEGKAPGSRGGDGLQPRGLWGEGGARCSRKVRGAQAMGAAWATSDLQLHNVDFSWEIKIIIRKLPGTGVLTRQEQLLGLGRVRCSLESPGQKQQRRRLQALAFLIYVFLLEQHP